MDSQNTENKCFICEIRFSVNDAIINLMPSKQQEWYQKYSFIKKVKSVL